MQVCLCFLLFGIFAYTNSQIRRRGDHRVFNLPQETDSAYSEEEYSGGTNNLDDVHNLIIRGTRLSNRNMKNVFRERSVETLTDFFQEAIKVLNTYEDTAFEDFFYVLDNEIGKCHYRGCKFSELKQNSDTRSLLAGSLKLIRGKPVSFTKAHINEVADMMRDETYDKNVKELLDYINSLYRNTELTFHNILNELKYYRNTKPVRTHDNLVQVIKNGVRAVLFNPYNELDIETRRELKGRIEIFWKQFKNNPSSRAEMNDILNTNPVVKSVIQNSFTVTENIINEVKNPEPYSKYDIQIQLQNKGEIIVGLDTNDEQFHRDETEKDESSNKSGEQITNVNKDEISSGQSFDSSSDSIKNSQERHEEYHTQRYMTLYAEEISYKAKTTKKTETIPISANVRTRRPKVKKRRMTTSTPRERDVSLDSTEKIKMLKANRDIDDTKLDISNSSHDTKSGLVLESKHEPRARENYDKQQKQFKADESKNMEIIIQYNPAIDVQLANTDLLKSLRTFEPADSDMNSRYDTILNSKSAIQTKTVPRKSTIRPESMRAQAEIIPQKPTAHIKPPSRYSKRNRALDRKQLSDLKRNSVENSDS